MFEYLSYRYPVKMAEAHDENSINTDLTFESGDENVSIFLISGVRTNDASNI